MDSDDDFLPPAQASQYRTFSQVARSQVTSSSNQAGPSQPSTSIQTASQPSTSRQHTASQPSTSRRLSTPGQRASSQPSASQVELSQIQDGLRFLMERVEQLGGDTRGIKRPAAEQKPYDKKPNNKEECQLCKKLYANKTTLFRHYRAMHQEMNPERFHGCSVDNDVVSLDASFREIYCNICGYIAVSQDALEAHNRTVHSNVSHANLNSNKENVNANVRNMHKCEECACYFEERSKFDEHNKVQHGFEVVCKICNKNLLFKDIDEHVKCSHPDVYDKKNKEKKVDNDEVIVKKVMKNKKGNRVHVFVCTECDLKMVDKIEAAKHARGHKKGLKIKTALRSKTKAKDNQVDVMNDDHVILTCVKCDISTGSYDAAVKHSQNHITMPDIQFVSQTCLICELKFETLCYIKHEDLHYKNKEINKESFKYYAYRYRLLLSEKWFESFNMAEPAVKNMISESIFEHTRTVKMRVIQEGIHKLYKCCQCDNFVEPTAVLNHTLNFDTCVKVNCSYSCHTCKRKFYNRLARNKHCNDHKSEETYKTVLFNHGNDKEINKILNDPNTRFDNNESQHAGAGANNSNDANNHTKLLFRCLCGLCFTKKESADTHAKVCPGKDPRKICPKCNRTFNTDELLSHCFEHHLNKTNVVTEDFTPDVIMIESDEESDDTPNEEDKAKDIKIIEIESTDEEVTQAGAFNNVKLEVLKVDDAATVRGSSEEVDNQNINAQENVITEATVASVQLVDSEAMDIQNNQNKNQENNQNKNQEDQTEDAESIDDDFDFGGFDTDDDSQNTISYESTETITVADSAFNTNNDKELKLVPISRLLSPLHFEHIFLDRVNVGVLNTDINNDIESIRHQIESMKNGATVVPFSEADIKREKSWLFDPTDFSNIGKRRSLRPTETHPIINGFTQDVVESLLTDDEEPEDNAANGEIDNDMPQDSSNNRSRLSIDACQVMEHTQNDNSVVQSKEQAQESNNTTNDICQVTGHTQKEDSTVQMLNVRTRDVNTVQQILHEQIRNGNTAETLNEILHVSNHENATPNMPNENYNVEIGEINNPVRTDSVQTEIIYNDNPATDVNTDPSYLINDKNIHSVDQNDDDDLFLPSGIQNSEPTKERDGNEISEIPQSRPEFLNQVTEPNMVISDNVNSSVTESMSTDNVPTDNKDNNDGEASQNDLYHSENIKEIEVDREQDATVRESVIVPNDDENTMIYEASYINSNEIDALNNNSVPSPESDEITKKQTNATLRKIKKEFSGFMNINIKRELIVEETGNGCDNLVDVKTEPNKYNENKENATCVTDDTYNESYKNCSIC